MKLPLLKTLFLALATFAFCAAAQAQVNVHIYRFGLQSSFSPHGASSKRTAENVFWYKNGSSWNSFGDKFGKDINISYSGKSPMVLYKKVGNTDTDESFKPAAQINLPPARDVFVIMLESGSAASFYPVNVSPDKLPKGKIAVMNMTKRGLAVMFGEDKKFLRAYTNAIFTQRKKKDLNPDPIVIAAKVNGQWEISYRSRMTYSKDKRSLLIIYDSSKKADTPSLNASIVEF